MGVSVALPDLIAPAQDMARLSYCTCEVCPKPLRLYVAQRLYVAPENQMQIEKV